MPRWQCRPGPKNGQKNCLDGIYVQFHPYFMKTIQISDFKQRCLSLLERLGPEGLIITKHGKPLARVVPFEQDCAGLIGALQGKVKVKGDILSTGVKWNAQS